MSASPRNERQEAPSRSLSGRPASCRWPHVLALLGSIVVCGAGIVLGLEKAAARVQHVGQAEVVARRVAGLVFIAAGAYSIFRFFQAWRGSG